jgi:hypothetical protein
MAFVFLILPAVAVAALALVPLGNLASRSFD